MIWGTTSYTPVPDPDIPSMIAWEETHRDLAPEELRTAVYAVEASTDHGRTYASNGLRWVSVDDAKRWAMGLSMRWFGATDIRVVRVTPPTVYQTTPAYAVTEVVYQTL